MKRMLLILCVLFLFGCNSKEPIPEDILKADRMTPVMVDLMYYQEMLRMQAMEKDSASAVYQQVLKPEVLKKHGVTSEDFERSYEFYLSDVEHFDEMWRSVVDTLSLRNQIVEARAIKDTIKD